MAAARRRSRSPRAHLTAASVALLSACANPPSAPPPATTHPVGGSTQTVAWDESGHGTTVQVDTSRTFVQVLWRDASARWQVTPATFAADGSFRVDGIPNGTPFWVRLFDGVNHEDRYIWSDQPSLDLGRDVAGRGDGVLARSLATKLEVDAPGLDPWTQNDALYLGVGNLGLAVDVWRGFRGSHGPEEDDTAVRRFSILWTELPLLDAAKGDKVHLVQMRHVDDEALGLHYDTAVRGVSLAPVSQTDGLQAATQGTFEDAPAVSIPVHWKRSAFAAMGPEIHPSYVKQPQLQRFWIHALPGGNAHGPISLYHLSLVDNVWAGAGNGDFTATIDTHNPYPASWIVTGASCAFVAQFKSPDRMYDAALDAEVGFLAPALPSADLPLAPQVGAVHDLAINGTPLLSDLPSVGTDLRVTWKAPLLGTMTSAEVHLIEPSLEYSPDISGARVVFHDLATLLVPGDVSEVQLPPDLVEKGHTYLLRVRAHAEAQQDVRRAPLRHHLPSAWADSITNYFTP